MNKAHLLDLFLLCYHTEENSYNSVTSDLRQQPQMEPGQTRRELGSTPFQGQGVGKPVKSRKTVCV
jgi:hypothetical protein